MTRPDSLHTLSRRSFLRLCGVTLAVAALPASLVRAAAAPEPLAVGRALRAAPLLNRPAGALVRRLWPDEVIAILGVTDSCYAVPDGYIAIEDLQPMQPYDSAAIRQPAALPAWVEVAAPSAAVRSFAAAMAPLRARLGYGGVLCAVDALHDDSGALWLAVSAAPQAAALLGWTPALAWTVADIPALPAAGSRRLTLDAAQALLIAQEDGHEVLRARVAPPADASAGTTYTVQARQPTFARPADAVEAGAAWTITTDGPLIYGAYWHNAFGRVHAGTGWEVPPTLARWLYGWLPDGGIVAVVG